MIKWLKRKWQQFKSAYLESYRNGMNKKFGGK